MLTTKWCSKIGKGDGGWEFRLGMKLFSLSFANDQVLTAKNLIQSGVHDKRTCIMNTKSRDYKLEKQSTWSLTSTHFEVLTNDDVGWCWTQIQQVDKFKYLGASINKNGIRKEEIRTKIQNNKKVIGCFNSLWWDRNIPSKTKKRPVRTLGESVLCYGSELWTLGSDTKRKIQAVEMNYLRRNTGISRMEKKTNSEIRHDERRGIKRIEKKAWNGLDTYCECERGCRRKFFGTLTVEESGVGLGDLRTVPLKK